MILLLYITTSIRTSWYYVYTYMVYMYHTSNSRRVDTSKSFIRFWEILLFGRKKTCKQPPSSSSCSSLIE